MARTDPKKYTLEIINAVCNDYVYFDDLIKEIAANYSIPRIGTISELLKKAVKIGFVSQEKVNEARHRRHVKKSQAYYDSIKKRDIFGERNGMFGRRGYEAPAFGRIGEANPMFGRVHSAESRRKISNRMKGENNPNFLNWSSLRGYSPEFIKIMRYYILERDGIKCQHCGKTEQQQMEEKNQGLSIHHIDYNKENNDERNLITLCTTCHVPTSMTRKGNRVYWEDLFNEKIEQIYIELSSEKVAELVKLRERLERESGLMEAVA